MYLSDRDLQHALDRRELFVEPRPPIVDACSIDLHLDEIGGVRVWDVEKWRRENAAEGALEPELRIGTFKYAPFGAKYLSPLPVYTGPDDGLLVSQRGPDVLIRPGGFVLWQTKELVGSSDDGSLICFVNGKSTRTARTGLLVHLTAPTIHATWKGRVTLELANLGPWTCVLREGDAVAQITVARLTSSPAKSVSAGGSVTIGQNSVLGSAPT